MIGTMNSPELNFGKINSIKQNFTNRINSITDIKNSSDIFNFIKKVRESGYTIDNSILEMKSELKSLGIN